MVAKVEGEKNLVVIERFGDCIYSMCTLKKELKVKDVRLVAKMARERDLATYVRTAAETMHVDGGEWWRRMTIRDLHSTNKQQVSLQFLIEDDIMGYIPRRSLLTSGRQIRHQFIRILLQPHSSRVTIPNSLPTQATLHPHMIASPIQQIRSNHNILRLSTRRKHH
jgi:hypothetical protein